MIERPQSEKLIELHVYVIPSVLWQDRLRSAVNQIISDTISAGFIRVRPDASLISLREEIVKQLGEDVIPREFIFCKSVGRCLTQVRLNQESYLKAYHFLPPNSYCPELFLLDIDTASRSTPSLKESIKSKVFNEKNENYNPSMSTDYQYHDINKYNEGHNNYDKHKDSNQINYSKDTAVNETHKASKDDYYRNSLVDINKSPGQLGQINLNDYPSLTSEERRMLQGMSENEVMEYLKSNGHIQPSDPYSHQNGSANDNILHPDCMYEDDGPQRLLKKSNNFGIIPTVNIEDSEFDDSHMSDMEKYEHYISLMDKYQSQRTETESRRDDLVRKAKQLYTKTANQKNIARDMWKKRYFEEKKRSPPMEDHLNKQRSELDSIHRKIMGMMENYIKENRSRGENQKVLDLGKMRMQSKKLEYEIEEAQRGVDEAKLKLTCEIKMTHQARAEVMAMRADLVQKKINLSMARNQHLSNMGTQDVYRPNRVSLIKPVS